MTEALVFVPVVLAANAVAFVLVRHDKARATRGGRRVPERTLLALALLGGWPAAGFAFRRYRHKTRKASFRRTFTAAALANLLLAAVVTSALARG